MRCVQPGLEWLADKAAKTLVHNLMKMTASKGHSRCRADCDVDRLQGTGGAYWAKEVDGADPKSS